MSPAEKHARSQMLEALSAYREDWMTEMPKEEITFGRYATLNRDQIDNAVVGMRLLLNLSGASMGNVDLYELVRVYLWDEEARELMNEVVRQSPYRSAWTGRDG